MTLLSFVNFGIAAMTGLLLNMGSVGNSTMNQTVASDEAVESKGCAANFVKDEQLRFKYIGPNFQKTNVENSDNWEIVANNDPLRNCDNLDYYACTILVNESFVGSSNNLLSTINLQADDTGISGIFHITGSDDLSMEYFNNSNIPLD